MDQNFKYTREQAIEDGVFVDVTKTATEVGYQVGVALTSNAYNRYVAVPKNYRGDQDERGRLWDILALGGIAARNAFGSNFTTFDAAVKNLQTGQHEIVEFWVVIESNKDGSPGINIMLPEDY